MWKLPMRKIAELAISAMLLFSCGCLAAGCSSDDSLAGTWECVSVSDGTVSYEVEDLELDGADFMTLKLRRDGTVSMTSMGEEVDTSDLTWQETDTGVSIESPSGAMDAVYDSSTDQLTLEYDDQVVVLGR